MMQVRILPAARERLLDIWKYTSKTWGDSQADEYVGDLVAFLEGLTDKQDLWRPVKEKRLVGVYCARFRHYYVFFKRLGDGSLGVISILHGSMDLPNRLKEDIDGER